VIERVPTDDQARAVIQRAHHLQDVLRIHDQIRAMRGGNWVHAAVFHRDGQITDLGVSPNLRTDDGDDWQAGAMGGLLGNSTGTPATATTATTLTVTGTPLTSNALKGRRIRTGADVYGNIGSNTTSVITVDQWWTVADGVATTPGSTAPFTIEPGYGPARFIALSENATAPAVTDTALTGEITTGGASRALGTYAHTAAALTYTLQKTFAITATFPAIHKAGMFTAGTLTAVGLMVFESVLNADANVISGDSLQITWTVTTA
jgi:hypothetical protein